MTDMMRLVYSIASTFMMSGMDEQSSYRKARHQVFVGGGSPVFIPNKHTVMSYMAQRRAAKKRRAVR